jgi:hypothetical protein
MICHTSLSLKNPATPHPSTLRKRVVVWQLDCRTCRTVAEPQVWQVWQTASGDGLPSATRWRAASKCPALAPIYRSHSHREILPSNTFFKMCTGSDFSRNPLFAGVSIGFHLVSSAKLMRTKPLKTEQYQLGTHGFQCEPKSKQSELPRVAVAGQKSAL